MVQSTAVYSKKGDRDAIMLTRVPFQGTNEISLAVFFAMKLSAANLTQARSISISEIQVQTNNLTVCITFL